MLLSKAGLTHGAGRAAAETSKIKCVSERSIDAHHFCRHSEFTMHAKKGVLDRAYDRLKRSIIDGAYRPGQQLKVLRVARELGISRTPVKEALGRLEQEGLIKREPGSGYSVRGLSVSDILNLYKVREALEVEAA